MLIKHYTAVFKALFIFIAVMLFYVDAQAVTDKNAACNTIAEVLRGVPGSAVEISSGQSSDNTIGDKGNGCLVRMKGTWNAIKDDLFPTDLLNPDSESSVLKKKGWSYDNRHAADGSDGTVFIIRKEDVICIVTGSWDGGDDSDPSYIPGDEYGISVECGPDED